MVRPRILIEEDDWISTPSKRIPKLGGLGERDMGRSCVLEELNKTWLAAPQAEIEDKS
jgi:hypothetical protein